MMFEQCEITYLRHLACSTEPRFYHTKGISTLVLKLLICLNKVLVTAGLTLANLTVSIY